MRARAPWGLLALVLAVPLAAQTPQDTLRIELVRTCGMAKAADTQLTKALDADTTSDAQRIELVRSRGFIRGSITQCAKSLAIFDRITGAPVPPDTTPPPPPSPPPTPPGAVAAHDFEDGTLGPYTTGGSTVVGQGDANIQAVDDPTGLFGGKVLRLTYHGSRDVNRAIRLRGFTLGPGETVFVSGRLLIPAGVDLNVMRKLFYFNPPSTAHGFVVVRVDGNGSRLFWKTETNEGNLTGPTFEAGVVHTLKVQVTLNHVGQADGIFRQWVNGQLIFERRDARLLTADVRYDKWTIGQQAQRWDLGGIDEVRYWDNIEFRR